MKNCKDCKYYNTSRCKICIDKKKFVQNPKKIKKVKKPKVSKRMGGIFEYNNTIKNNSILNNSHTVSRNTLNSGATELEKGDEIILGNVNIIEELKTSTIKKAKGKESFSIKKEWLDKLKRETPKEIEFYYLKFAFYEQDDEAFVVVENDQLLRMISVIADQREEIKDLKREVELTKKKRG